MEDRPRYYRRDGTPYKDVLEWARDFEELSKDDGRRVAKTDLPDGKWVSTVWLGMDHSYGFGPPKIFETMVFGETSMGELDCERYTTEAEALDGHRGMVLKWLIKGGKQYGS